MLAVPLSGHSDCLRDICLDASDGKPVCTRQFKGHPFLVDFWAAWCPKCRNAFQWHQSQKSKGDPTGLQTILINLDPDKQDALNFLKEIESTSVILYDPEGKTAEQCALESIPAAILFDSSGREVRRWYGFNSAIQDEFSKLYSTGGTREKK